MTLRTEILAWIMFEVEARESDLLRIFGSKEAAFEIRSLIDLGVIRRRYKSKGVFYEVAPIWAKRKG